MRSRPLRRAAAALAFVVCCASLATPARAQDDSREPGIKLANARFNQEARAALRSQRLRVSAGPDPDTVWIGHSYTDHWSATNNWWNVYVGTNRPGTGDPNNAVWDWDHTTGFGTHGVTDSLAGWWPARRVYSVTGGMTLPDASRPWWALDYGNDANYVMNAGPGQKRTCGVVGVWHGDAGRNQPGGSAVQWRPLSGTRSAWCGLRQAGDNSVYDPVTNNPYNAMAMQYTGNTTPSVPTAKRFPGYANQWDQILYRDVVPPAGQALDLAFLYRTRMSTSATTTASTRTGWFHGDPLAVTAGNFISSTDAGANAPIDSFTVYVGAPVDDADCLYSDGARRVVYDPQRRWFSEVLRLFDAPVYRVFGTAGNVPSDTAAATPTATVTLTAQQVDAIRDVAGNTGHRLRLAFRVKTNRGFADDDGAGLFSSFSRGAAIVDSVTVNGAVIGDFEGAEQSGPNSIDNRIGADPLDHWKSTGKPPAVYFHLENVTDGSITYSDLCGPWDSPARFCNISGLVMVAGNHDDFERHGDSRFASSREIVQAFCSPTINLVVDESGSNAPNAMGVTQSIKDVTDDYYLWYDVYAGMFNLQFTGNSWSVGAQAYPAYQPNNGAKGWGDPCGYTLSIFNPEPQCFWDIEPLYALAAIAVTTPSGLPDSLRVCLLTQQQCFRFGVSLGCNSADGAYFDNISVGCADTPVPAQVSAANAINASTLTSDIWEWINDAFPANETPSLPNSADFDTSAALVKGGVNGAPSTGNALRFDVPADTILVRAPNVSGSTDPTFGNQTRADFVFRILPGPGNYERNNPSAPRSFPPTSSMHLLRLPTDQANFAAAGDGSFWGAYLAVPGKFSAGDHHGGTSWDYLTWNSCRADTAEQNVFPVSGKIGSGLTAGTYASMIHEADPKFPVLGIDKFRCFVVDTALAAIQTNIACNGSVPTWLTVVPARRTGWDGSATTKEFTKIIPDGLLTPGAHVQYFWRKSALADSSVFKLDPDTNTVYQLTAEGSSDGHRWQQFGVLPDRWKDPAFGGAGMACMLYVDLNDRRGNERVFVSVMDSIGGTMQSKWGAHNGWHAPAIYGGTSADLDLYPVVGRNQQPGTTWDMYGVKASESLTTSANTLGNRLANRAGMGLLAGKEARIGPTPEMLRKFYRLVTILSGDLNSGVLGPFANRSQNDVALLNDYLTGNDVGSTPQPRGLFVMGDGFAQSEVWSGGIDPAHTLFLAAKLGVTLRNLSYPAVSGNTNDCADLVTAAAITPNGDVYGVGNSCAWSNDLYQRNPSVAEAVEAAYYENVGPNGPYVAAVLKPAAATRNWVALTSGWDLEHAWSRFCGTSGGRLAYLYNAYVNAFAALCLVTPTPAQVLDVPQAGHGGVTRFMAVGNSVMRGGASQVRFGVDAPQRVRVRLYDVAGRQVRTLADRTFAVGEHAVSWDGADDAGRQVARGVYFARLEYALGGPAMTSRVVVLR